MKPAIDLIGSRFNRLLVISREPNAKDGETIWRCRCDCGEETSQRSKNLRRGLVRSCGCLRRETSAAMGRGGRTHGQTLTPEYRAWRSAIARCHKPTDCNYRNYGARGIAVADEWRTDFQAFFDHIGPRPSKAYTLDRIDNAGNYAPGNVRWATYETQGNNKRTNHIVNVDGVDMTLAEAIRLKGQKSNVVRQRLAFGWTLERALNENAVPRNSRNRR